MFDETVYEHWQEAGKTKEWVLDVRHKDDDSKSKQHISYKRTLTMEDEKLLYAGHPVGDAVVTDLFTLRQHCD